MGENDQKYEDYWKLTLEYSDIHGEKFMGTLKLIIDFIDNLDEEYSKEVYERLQEKVNEKYPKEDMASVRKSINQFVKLGFVNYHLESYHRNCRDFLNSKTKRKRRSVFSKILYENSSFNSSVTNKSDKQEINFLLRTLANLGKLHKKDIIALMLMANISEKDYLRRSDLEEIREYAKEIDFTERKYNQVGYLWNILNNKLENLYIQDDYVCFKEDAEEVFGEKLREFEKNRDPYLYRLYKNELKHESKNKLGAEMCMIEKLDYPTLIASHIKPFSKSSEQEAYDSNNGLLLSRNIDALFDLGYISFRKNGALILSERLSKTLQKYLSTKDYSLDNIFINEERVNYLEYHRENVLE